MSTHSVSETGGGPSTGATWECQGQRREQEMGGIVGARQWEAVEQSTWGAFPAPALVFLPSVHCHASCELARELAQ